MIPKSFVNQTSIIQPNMVEFFYPKKGFDNGMAPYLLKDKGLLLLF